jgi:hypothetical protein
LPADSDVADTNDVDGYLAAGDVAGVVSRHGLTRDEEARESLDVRERRAGLDALDRALEAFRG